MAPPVRTPFSSAAGMDSLARTRSFTREEYFQMVDTGILDPDDRTELLDGRIIEMTAQNAPHGAAVIKATEHFIEVFGMSHT